MAVNGQDGSGFGIYAKVFAGDGIALAAPLFGTQFDDVLDLTDGDVAAFGLAGNDTYIVDSSNDLTIELIARATTPYLPASAGRSAATSRISR